jgi:DNA-binding phage protein
MRSYCERGLIREAEQTIGGHWRIRLPFSARTRLLFQRLAGNKLFSGKVGEAVGVSRWQDDFELWLCLLDRFPDDGEKLDDQISALISDRIKSGEGFADLLLRAAMLCVVQEDGKLGAANVASALGLSRQMLYRNFTKKEIGDARKEALTLTRREPPVDRDGEDPAKSYHRPLED